MYQFPVADIYLSPVGPVLVGFLVAAICTPAGISGAFLLLPFQMSVLGFTSPAVSPTNLLYSVISTPGGIFRYGDAGQLHWPLIKIMLLGTLPGVLIGVVLRVQLFSRPNTFKGYVGAVLVVLGIRLLLEVRKDMNDEAEVLSPLPISPVQLFLLAFAVGIIGGIYGIGGGAVVAPFLVAVLGLPVYWVAGAALVATFITSAAGVLSFEIVSVLETQAARSFGPDWLLGTLFGIGGLPGSYVGASLQRFISQRVIQSLLAVLILVVGASYVVPIFTA
jgi:uncharacterized membrane protein YfcA